MGRGKRKRKAARHNICILTGSSLWSEEQRSYRGGGGLHPNVLSSWAGWPCARRRTGSRSSVNTPKDRRECSFVLNICTHSWSKQSGFSWNCYSDLPGLPDTSSPSRLQCRRPVASQRWPVWLYRSINTGAKEKMRDDHMKGSLSYSSFVTSEDVLRLSFTGYIYPLWGQKSSWSISLSNSPVCVHSLLQLVIEDKLWVPEENMGWVDESQILMSVNLINKLLPHKLSYTSFSLPFVSFDVVSLHVLEVMSEMVLQGGHHAAVLVQQLGGPRLSCEPVHHCWELLLLDLLDPPPSVTRRQDRRLLVNHYSSNGWL